MNQITVVVGKEKNRWLRDSIPTSQIGHNQECYSPMSNLNNSHQIFIRSSTKLYYPFSRTDQLKTLEGQRLYFLEKYSATMWWMVLHNVACQMHETRFWMAAMTWQLLQPKPTPMIFGLPPYFSLHVWQLLQPYPPCMIKGLISWFRA